MRLTFLSPFQRWQLPPKTANGELFQSQIPPLSRVSYEQVISIPNNTSEAYRKSCMGSSFCTAKLSTEGLKRFVRFSDSSKEGTQAIETKGFAEFARSRGGKMAETARGFEPPLEFPLNPLSKPAPSASRPPVGGLRCDEQRRVTYIALLAAPCFLLI